MRARVVLILCLAATPGQAEQWAGSWGFPATGSPSPTVQPVADFENVTVRQIVRLSADARRIRIRISNEFGDQPLRLEAVHLAVLAHDGDIVGSSDRILTFSGNSVVAVPPHAPFSSDALDWPLPAFARLAVSIYIRKPVTPPAHRASQYVATGGDFTSVEHMPGAQMVRTGVFVSAVEIVSPHADRTLVTFGDSITEGFGSTVNEFAGWVDVLAERLHANHRTSNWSVADAGINSNRLLHDLPGTNALARFDRDVLSIPGVSAVILLEGINDIGYSHTHPEEAVTAAQIIDAYRQLIARAHAHGIAIFGATLTPFSQSHYYDCAGETSRHAVNAWIRASRAFDGVIDFDAALRDPANPDAVRADLQRGDHLHPNDAGYRVMANSVDLGLLARSKVSAAH